MARGPGEEPCRGTCWVQVDLGAVASNLDRVRALVAPGTPVLAIVKANAYGHGAVPVSRALFARGADALGVATLEEGIELREAGIDGRVLVLGRILPAQLDGALRWRLEVAVPEAALAEELSRRAVRKGLTARVHLKVDTGMTRLGVPVARAAEAAARIRSLPGLELYGIFSHFANADLADRTLTDSQVRAFESLRAELPRSGEADFHLANSAAVLTSRVPPGSMVRPGIMLYGSLPSPALASASLAPALSWHCSVLQVHEVGKGTGVSYGHTFVTARPSRIATVSVGYADGYRRCLTNRGHVLVQGRRAPVVGRVCMDMTMVDVTDIPDAAAGDEVVLIGPQGGERITVEEVAAWAETISYEIFCGISPRVPRYYKG